MSRYYRIGACLLLCILALSGCGQTKGPDTINTTTISVSDKGAVTAYLVGDFDREYYNLSELTAMAMEEAAQYNTSHAVQGSTPITVQKVENAETGDKVIITYQFDKTDTFNDYCEGVLFYGTVTEAVAEGYGLESSPLTSVKDGSLVTDGWMKQEAAGRHILITDQKAEIYCPYKVTHISEGAVYNADGSVDATQTEGNVVILMKK